MKAEYDFSNAKKASQIDHLNRLREQQDRPITPLVPMDLSDNEATKRLISHVAKRVIKDHKQELQKLAYR